MANIASIGSLFKKSKNDPEFAAAQQRVRQSLLKTLSRAIKEVQLLSTQSGEGGRAVEDCHSTRRLCTAFENALRHGLKSRWFGPGGSFWPLVLQISRKQAIEYISGLQHAVSEMGKCRAWIRMAVNECSLESYIGVICQDTSLANQHYESHAFMRDEDVVGPLQLLLAGLSQINFNITVDTASLEYEAVPEALQPPLQLRLPHQLLADEEVHRKKRRRKPKSKSHDRHVIHIVDSSEEEISDIEPGGAEEDGEGKEGEEGEKEDDEMKYNDIMALSQPAASERDSHHQRLTGVASRGSLVWPDNERDKTVVNEEEEKVEDADMEGVDEGGLIGEETNRGIMTEGEGGGRGEGEGGGGELENREIEVIDFGGFLIEDSRSQSFAEDAANHVEDSNKDSTTQNESAQVNISTINHIQGSHGDEVSQMGQASSTYSQDMPLDGSNAISTTISIGMDGPYTIVKGETEQGDEELEVEERLKDEEESNNGQRNTAMSLEEEFRALRCDSADLNQPPYLAVITQFFPVSSPDHSVPNPDQLTRPTLQSSAQFDTDTSTTATNQFSRNPFDMAEQDLSSTTKDHTRPTAEDHTYPIAEDHTHLNWERKEKGRNPFDESPQSSLSPSPSHSPPLPRHTLPTLTHNNFHTQTTTTTTTMNPFDSAQTTPPTSFASPTSSDLISEDPPTITDHQKEGGGNGRRERRVERSDSLEWSVYLEQSMVDFPEGVSSTELDLDEDHYSPELGVAELEEMIRKLKEDLISISTSSPSLSSAEAHSLRGRIVQLQLKLQTKKEEEESIAPYVEVSGHKFVRQARQRRVLKDFTCLACKKKVRDLIREWLRCKICQSVCHQKCLSTVISPCSLPADDVQYILQICPEVGLTDQQFRCVRCNRQLTQTPPVEVRLCDYDGQYYCPDCHVNDLSIIPARVMHNWDFVPRTVCCQCSSILFHLSSRPLLKVQSVNPLLYTHIHDLVEVERLRRDLLVMKTFLSSCRLARDLQLLHRLDIFPNFKEDASLLTLLEIVEIQNGSLLPKLTDIHSSFSLHITSHCQTCLSQGQTCSLCHSTETIFPFGHQISRCPGCLDTFHKDCFREVNSCPTCHRPRT